LDHLLTLARAHEIDLTRLSLGLLVDQLAAALDHAPAAMPLAQKGDWVVMTAWLVQLRARLLPTDPAAQQHAAAQAVELRDRLVELPAMQALARWLEGRPQVGRDVFARGPSEGVAAVIGVEHEVDVVGFLWASLALFDAADDAVDTASVYPPQRREWYSVAEARARILALLAETPEGQLLDRFLPPVAGDMPSNALRRRSAWASTLIASLELAKQGDLTVAQAARFAPIHLSRPSALPPA
jgi:segregation and condensation protein A